MASLVAILAQGVAWSALATPAHANPALPTGSAIVAGGASFARSTTALTINQTSAKAIIDWTGFSIGAGGTVRFNNGSGATLNRVTGTGVSSIDGALTATGSVFLLNPNGVIIGKTGVVHTGGSFIASTLSLADANFLGSGARIFSGGSSASVINLGKVGSLGGNVALIAAHVGNSGSITAPRGDVGLIAGQRVVVQDSLLDNGMFLVQAGGAGTDVTNTGGITAAAAELRANGGNVYALAGNSTGVIKATGIGTLGGHVWIIADGAGKTTVSAAIAATKGNGDGGLVETSGGSVDFTGARIDTRGLQGAAGTWLVDPTNLTIDAAAAATISANLATSNVTLQTNADGTTSGPGIATPGAGNIYVNSAVNWASANTLALSSYRDIVVGANVTSSGGGGVNLHADNSGRGVGTVGFASGVKISTAGSVTVYYNPSSNHYTATPSVNLTSYLTANDYSANAMGGGLLTAYMLVNNVFDLQNIQNNPASNYALGRNVDASATATWNSGTGFVPIGTLTGAFDGLSHSINGLFINNTGQVSGGLFSSVGKSGIISNVSLVGGSLTEDKIFNQYGIQSLNFGALAGSNYGTIRNSYANITLTSLAFWPDQIYVGGLTGQNFGSIIASYFMSKIVSSGGFQNVGGLAGQNDGIITSSYALGSIHVSYDLSYVGGLVGSNGSGSISSSYAGNDIHVPFNATTAGGIAGISGGYIENVYAAGSLTANNSATQSSNVFLGGIAGEDSNIILNVFSAEKISNVGISPERGGITAFFTGPKPINSYYDIQILPVSPGSFTGGTGLSTAQLQNFSTYSTTFAGFDFANVWSPPTQVGQAGQTAAYYPQLYAISPVIFASAKSTNKIYGTANPNLGIYGGPGAYIFSPQADSLPSASLVSTTATAASSVGNYAITSSGMNTITSTRGVTYRVISDPAAGNLQITPRSVSVAGQPETSVYGNSIPALAYTTAQATADTGLINGDTLAGALTTGATPTSNVGQYAITQGSLASTANYTLTYTPAYETITQRDLSVTALPQTSIYGNAVQALQYSVAPSGANSGLINGDTLAGMLVTTASPTANVGQYAITQGSLTASSNYNLIYTGAFDTITPRAVSVNALATTSIYGNAVPTLQYNVAATDANSGLLNGDTLSGALATTASPTANVGQYAITLGTLVSSPNYYLQYNGAFETITPRSLFVTALPETIGYGQAIPTLAYTIARKRANTGLVNGDSLSGALATIATPASSVGKYAITQGSLAATPNYKLVYTGAKLTIHP